MSFLRSLSRNCSFGNWRGFLSTQYAPNLTCKVALRLQELAGYSVLPRVCHYRTVHRLSTGGAIKKNSKQYMCMWSRSQIAASLLSQNVHEFQANTSFEEQKLSSEEQRETSEEQNASSKKKIPFYQEQSNTLQKKTSKKFGTHNYDFDDNGYLSVDDLIKFLKHEAAFDICVIETSGAQRAYVDFFVVVSGVSNRHIHAMAKNLETLVSMKYLRDITWRVHNRGFLIPLSRSFLFEIPPSHQF